MAIFSGILTRKTKKGDTVSRRLYLHFETLFSAFGSEKFYVTARLPLKRSKSTHLFVFEFHLKFLSEIGYFFKNLHILTASNIKNIIDDFFPFS